MTPPKAKRPPQRVTGLSEDPTDYKPPTPKPITHSLKDAMVRAEQAALAKRQKPR